MTVGSEFRKCESAWVSLSCYATVQLTAFRNKEDENGKPQEMGCPETFARRFTAEIGYALLFVVSLIETVVRLALSLIVIPLTCAVGCCSEIPDPIGRALIMTASGVILSAENVANTAVAFFTNPCETEVKYDKLIPCFVEANGRIDVSMFKG